jgi:hypothetical protein
MTTLQIETAYTTSPETHLTFTDMLGYIIVYIKTLYEQDFLILGSYTETMAKVFHRTLTYSKQNM